jgi:hypothetical protein
MKGLGLMRSRGVELNPSLQTSSPNPKTSDEFFFDMMIMMVA